MDNLDQCVQMLKRIAWRLQYQEKKRRKRERVTSPEHFLFYGNRTCSFQDPLSDIRVQELLHLVTSDTAKEILRKSYLEDKTEKDIAIEMQISQQAVNKWKKKGLMSIRRTLASQSS
ncbi:RNA polymerase sigma factor [Paenibacillus chartarius]|uniref:RNA polymerase sigma factor n=1 Tax=Paenibacillus chartarius TaxID=747481 RepID=A0ABV6DHT7_9BACL